MNDTNHASELLSECALEFEERLSENVEWKTVLLNEIIKLT